MDPIHEEGIEDKIPETAVSAGKKPWLEPEITHYEQVQAVTLGIYCTGSLPPFCQSPAVVVI